MAARKKPPPRRLSKQKPKAHPFAAKTAEGQAKQLANLRHAPPAPPGHARNGTTMVQSKQPEMLVGLDGTTFEMRRQWFRTLVLDANVDALYAQALVVLTETDLHHYLCCAPLVPSMTYNQGKLHLRRGKFVLSLLGELGLTPMAQSKLGLREAQELATRHQSIKPVRTVERAREVANLLDRYGILPPAETVDADVVEDTPAAELNPDDTSEPLPEAAQRDLGVRSIFDRGL